MRTKSQRKRKTNRLRQEAPQQHGWGKQGKTRCFWRIDPNADYGPLNSISTHQLALKKITPHWDDMLRLVGSLKLGMVPAIGIMRTLQVGDQPTGLAKAIAEYGRADKTISFADLY